MRRAVSIGIGVILLLIGLGWASQGAGILGGSSLMDNNLTFVYLGGALAIVGIALIARGAMSETRARSASAM